MRCHRNSVGVGECRAREAPERSVTIRERHRSDMFALGSITVEKRREFIDLEYDESRGNYKVRPRAE